MAVPFRAVVFDMDGIIFDTEPLYFAAEVELLRRRGMTFTVDMAQRMMGMPGLAATQLLANHYGLTEAAEALFAETQTLFRQSLATQLRLMPGALELLTLLETHRFRKGLATSTQRQLTDHMIDQHQLRERFEFLLTKDDVAQGKPHPEIYQKACARLGIPADQVLVLEDSYNGATAAKAAGCRCVAIPHALSQSIDFSFADLVAEHLLDARILQLLGIDR